MTPPIDDKTYQNAITVFERQVLGDRNGKQTLWTSRGDKHFHYDKNCEGLDKDRRHTLNAFHARISMLTYCPLCIPKLIDIPEGLRVRRAIE